MSEHGGQVPRSARAVRGPFVAALGLLLLLTLLHAAGLALFTSGFLLQRVELTELRDRQIGSLSGGQRKRAFVARGLAQGASILLLDEPFAGVDKRTEATITEVLVERANAGATVLVSTHDLQALPRLADEAVLLQRHVIAQGPPDEVITTENLIRAFGIDPLVTDRDV